ncbi:proline-rich protein 36-like [Macrobrachium rosenbergii]|uniref:proline-rich protein 36-like n=1 Tax=Macrobrachium rosenbergii TaxID=79674 RepID=UPI0034D42135
MAGRPPASATSPSRHTLPLPGPASHGWRTTNHSATSLGHKSKSRHSSSLPGPSFPWLGGTAAAPTAGRPPTRPQVQVEALSAPRSKLPMAGTASVPNRSATSLEALSSLPGPSFPWLANGLRPPQPLAGHQPRPDKSKSRHSLRSQVQAPMAGERPPQQPLVPPASATSQVKHSLPLPGPPNLPLPVQASQGMVGGLRSQPWPGHHQSRHSLPLPGPAPRQASAPRSKLPMAGWPRTAPNRWPATSLGHKSSRGTLFRLPGSQVQASHGFPWLANGQAEALSSAPRSPNPWGHQPRHQPQVQVEALSSAPRSKLPMAGMNGRPAAPNHWPATSLGHKSKSRHFLRSQVQASHGWPNGLRSPNRWPATSLATSPSRGTLFRSQVQSFAPTGPPGFPSPSQAGGSRSWLWWPRTATAGPPASTTSQVEALSSAPRSKLPMAGMNGLRPPTAGRPPASPQVQVEALSSAPRSKLPMAGERPPVPQPLAATSLGHKSKSRHSLPLPGPSFPWLANGPGPQPLAGHQPQPQVQVEALSSAPRSKLPMAGVNGRPRSPPTAGRPPASTTSPSRGTLFRSQVQASHGWRTASGPPTAGRPPASPKSKSRHFLPLPQWLPMAGRRLRPPTAGGHQPQPKSKSRHSLPLPGPSFPRAAQSPNRWPATSLATSPSRGTLFRSQVQASHGWRPLPPMAGHKSKSALFRSLQASGPQPMPGRPPATSLGHKSKSRHSLSAPRSKLPMAGERPPVPQPLAATSLGHKSSRGTLFPLPGPIFRSQVQASHGWPGPASAPPNRWPATSHKSSRGTLFRSQVQASHG